MSNFQIHELSTGALDRDSYIVHDSEVSGNFQTRKDTAGAVADLALEVVASEYDDTASYTIGSYCIYSGVLYRCNTATTGVFDVSDWTAVLITGEYKRVRVMHKADFDLLTPEEQADGMIFVDDVDITAADISYDNTASGLSADDLQEAVDEVVSNANTVHQYTASYTHASINQGNIYAYSIGKIYMLTGYMRANAIIASNTVIGSVTGVTLANEIFSSSVGENGTGLRLLNYSDGRFRIERQMPANEWFSFTLVGFLA